MWYDNKRNRFINGQGLFAYLLGYYTPPKKKGARKNAKR